MDIDTILALLQNSGAIAFLATYASTKGLDFLLDLGQKKRKFRSPEAQLLEVLKIALHDTYKEFKIKKDFDKVLSSFSKSLAKFAFDIDEYKLRSIIISSMGLNNSYVDDTVIEYWINRFDRTISDPQYQWLLNFINRRSQRNTQTNVETDKVSEKTRYQRYVAHLHELMYKNVPYDNFSLNDIYIQLYGYYMTFTEYDYELHPGYFGTHNIVSTEEWILDWVSDKEDYNILLVSGKPASGKTTLLKRLALKLSEDKYIVALIPLNSFVMTTTISESVDRFCLEKLGMHPFNCPFPNKGIVLLFDGLDEIALCGTDSLRKASNFIEQIIRTYRGKDIKIIVSGRSLSISSVSGLFTHNLREYIIRLLPLYTDPDYIDTYWRTTSEVEIVDQRPLWWEKYGNVRHTDYSNLQTEIEECIQCQDVTFDELTAEPFLLYLLASSYENKVHDFTQKLYVNTLYDYFVKKIYKNDWKDNFEMSTIIDENVFIGFMQEIAICAWHSGENIIPLRSIEARCTAEYLEVIQYMTNSTNKSEGITNLLLLFYIDKRLTNKNEQSFEFTHKSFSDYFVGRKIASFIIEVFSQCYSKDTYDKLFDLLGQQYLDVYIDEFMCNEFRRIFSLNNLIIEEVCNRISQVFPKLISNDPSYCRILVQNGHNYLDSNSIILEKNIFRIMCALAKIRGKNITIPFINSFHFMEWINSSKDWYGFSIDTPQEYVINVTRIISRIDFIRKNGLMFIGILLQNYQISDCTFQDANLEGAIMRWSKLFDNVFCKVNCNNVDFTYAVLKNINFSTEALSESFYGTIFAHCTISNSYFEGAKFTKVNFADATITETTFENCLFVNCIFNTTKIHKTNFVNCKFDCLMTDSTLESSNFVGNCTGLSLLSSDVHLCKVSSGDTQENLIDRNKADTKNAVFCLMTI